MHPSLTEKQRRDIDVVRSIIQKDFEKNCEIRKKKLSKNKPETDDAGFPKESKKDYKIDQSIRSLL